MCCRASPRRSTTSARLATASCCTLPAYPPFLELIRETGRTLVEVPAVPTADGFVWDYDELDRGSPRHDGAAARLWILCHPQNPTGRVFERAELEVIAELAAKHDLVVVSDEIHAELVHPGHDHTPFADARRRRRGADDHRDVGLEGVQPRRAALGDPPRRTRPFHASARRRLPTHYLGTPNLLAVEATDAAWTEETTGWRRCDESSTTIDAASASLLAAQLPGSSTARRRRRTWRGSIVERSASATILRRRSASAASSWPLVIASARSAPDSPASTSPPARRPGGGRRGRWREDSLRVIGHQPVGGNRPEAAGLEVLERLGQLVAGVHDERPVGGHRLADRPSTQQVDVERLVRRRRSA